MMTNEEAIQMLDRILDPDPWEDCGLSDKAREALEMAKEALRIISSPSLLTLYMFEMQKSVDKDAGLLKSIIQDMGDEG